MREDSTPLCACGCGQPVMKFQSSCAARGQKKGEYGTWLRGHYRRAVPARNNAERLRDYRRSRGSQPKFVYLTDQERLEAKRARDIARYQRKREQFDEFMKVRVCEQCGASDKEVPRLEWHHRDPETKTANVANMVNTHRWARIMAEVAKCKLLCPECHKRAHHELNDGRYQRIYGIDNRDSAA